MFMLIETEGVDTIQFTMDGPLLGRGGGGERLKGGVSLEVISGHDMSCRHPSGRALTCLQLICNRMFS